MRQGLRQRRPNRRQVKERMQRLDQLGDLGKEAARVALDGDLARNDVGRAIGENLRAGDYSALKRVDLARDDGLKLGPDAIRERQAVALRSRQPLCPRGTVLMGSTSPKPCGNLSAVLERKSPQSTRDAGVPTTLCRVLRFTRATSGRLPWSKHCPAMSEDCSHVRTIEPANWSLP